MRPIKLTTEATDAELAELDVYDWQDLETEIWETDPNYIYLHGDLMGAFEERNGIVWVAPYADGYEDMCLQLVERFMSDEPHEVIPDLDDNKIHQRSLTGIYYRVGYWYQFYHLPIGFAINGSRKKITEIDPLIRRDDKRKFLEWKRAGERQGRAFYNRLSEVMDTQGMDDFTVGDTVLFTNAAGITFGPFEVLAIDYDTSYRTPRPGVFLDMAPYWNAVRPETLTLV